MTIDEPMEPDVIRFEPAPASSPWIDPGLVLVLVVVIGSGVLWWQRVPWSASIPILAVAAGLVLVRWHYGRRHRGTITLGPDGVTVATRAGVFERPWQQIHRVYRFKDQLVFETVAPHRRHTLALDGHEHHRRALLDGLAQWGRTLDLRWAEHLAGALDR
jgi:hypothetical protein